MKHQSKIIILRGNSGSGKTTLAKRLQEKLGRETLLLSQDVIRREMLKVKDGVGTKAVPLLCELVIYGKNNCDFVILEGILNSSWYKELFKEIKNNFCNVYAYYYDLSFDETMIRHQTKPNSNEFGEAQMKRWWNEKDYIEMIPEKMITKELSLNEAVEMIYKDVTKT